MAKFTKEMVNDYADKLLIGLTEEELNNVLAEFSVIDESIAKISTIKDIDKVTPMTHCLDNTITKLREDEASPSSDIKDILKNCENTYGRYVEVPKVVGGD